MTTTRHPLLLLRRTVLTRPIPPTLLRTFFSTRPSLSTHDPTDLPPDPPPNVSFKDFAFLNPSNVTSKPFDSPVESDDGDVGLVCKAVESEERPGRKSELFDEKTKKVLRRFREKLNPTLAVEVLRRLKRPETAARFFMWAGRQIGYSHTAPVYDALLMVLGFSKAVRIPQHLLHEIGGDDKEVLRRVMNALVCKCCRSGFWNIALEELGRLKDFGYRPSPATYNSLVRVLLAADRLDSAVLVHREMLDSGHVMDRDTMGCFVGALCKVGRWAEALQVMDKEEFRPDTDIYNRMIGGLMESSLFDEAMSFLHRMRTSSLLPNVVTYTTLLSGFLRKKQLGWCKRILNMMMKEGFSPSMQLFNSLLHAYCSTGDYSYSYKLLNKMKSCGIKPGYITYNGLIGGICGYEDLPSKDAFQLAEKAYKEMLDAGFVLNKVNVGNYTRCLCSVGKFDKAFQVIKELMGKGFIPDTSTYTQVIEYLCTADKVEKALLLFYEMKEKHIVPDVYTYSILIDRFCKAGLLQQGRKLFDEMIVNGCAPNVVTFTSLIHAYLKCKRVLQAHELFEWMLKQGCQPNLVTYSALIDGLCKIGKIEEACQIYSRMKGCNEDSDSNSAMNFKDTDMGNIEPNVFTYGALIDGLCKAGKVTEAQNLLEVMSNTGCEPNNVVYDALVNGLAKAGMLDEVQKIIVRMSERGYRPNVFTYSSLIDRLFKDKRLDLALKVLSKMLENSCTPNVVTYTEMVDGLCKAGETDEAYQLLLMMEEKGCKPNVVTYTAMIDGIGKTGKIEKCFELFRLMTEKGCSPNFVTYRVLIDHCCAAGHLDEASDLLDEMRQTYWPTNLASYNKLIKGYSREFLISHGLLEETAKVGMGPVVLSYCVLIDSFSKSSKLEVALELYKELVATSSSHLSSDCRSTFSCLVESLCLASKVDVAFEVYVDMTKKGMIPEITVLFHLVKGLIKVGKVDEALQLSYCLCQME